MMKASVVALVVAASGLLPWRASAQVDNGPELPSMFRLLRRPMDQLLNDGWRINSTTVGIDSITFTIERQGKWVVCSLRNSGKPAPGIIPSQCFELN